MPKGVFFLIQTIALESEYIPIIEDFHINFYFKFIFEKFIIESFEPVSIVEYQLYYVDTDCIAKFFFDLKCKYLLRNICFLYIAFLRCLFMKVYSLFIRVQT
jgi:hypothetical protein